MGKTDIEWSGYTWNAIRARLLADELIQLSGGKTKLLTAGTWGYHCERISPGCGRCYSCTMNGRTLPAWGTGLDFTVPNRSKVEIYLDQDALKQPLKWRKPSKIFPCSMTDWCAEFVPDEFRESLLAVAALTPRHTYQFLTKRADDMRRFFLEELALAERSEFVMAQAAHTGGIVWDSRGSDRHAYFGCGQIGDISNRRPWPGWPLKNVQLGTSVEDQQRADQRRPHLKALASKGWLTWVSYEPALGPVDWRGWEFLQWMVIGFESGTEARGGELEWIRSTLRWCRENDVVPFVKQIGAKPLVDGAPYDPYGTHPPRTYDRKGGNMNEWPEDIRVREMPEVPNASA